ncbi:MAG: hypothetical protein OXF74_06590 [Rhodobacteraceae bacterium]|nr:hypothetical protein [Paracoccaceae bacterium]
MPDNRRSGELEDFVQEMIPPADPVWPLAERYINGIPAADRKFSDSKLTRAYVHAWLATREKPRPMGTAITARDLNYDTPLANTFIKWLHTLFDF